jgi:hypothetical protein
MTTAPLRPTPLEFNLAGRARVIFQHVGISRRPARAKLWSVEQGSKNGRRADRPHDLDYYRLRRGPYKRGTGVSGPRDYGHIPIIPFSRPTTNLGSFDEGIVSLAKVTVRSMHHPYRFPVKDPRDVLPFDRTSGWIAYRRHGQPIIFGVGTHGVNDGSWVGWHRSQ